MVLNMEICKYWENSLNFQSIRCLISYVSYRSFWMAWNLWQVNIMRHHCGIILQEAICNQLLWHLPIKILIINNIPLFMNYYYTLLLFSFLNHCFLRSTFIQSPLCKSCSFPSEHRRPRHKACEMASHTMKFRSLLKDAMSLKTCCSSWPRRYWALKGKRVRLGPPASQQTWTNTSEIIVIDHVNACQYHKFSRFCRLCFRTDWIETTIFSQARLVNP